MTQAFYIGSQFAITQATQAVRELKPFSKLIVEIKPLTRSLAQNRLYHMWVRQLSDATGYQEWELTQVFKDTFLPDILDPTEVNRLTLKPKELSTTMCNTAQMTKYLNQIEIAGNEMFGVVLSHPDDLFQEAMGRARNVQK